MEYNFSKETAFVVQSAYLDLLEAISKGASKQSEIDIQSLHSEAEKFIVAMIASITLVDGAIKQEEAEFLCKLLNIHKTHESAIRYVNEYASRWPILSASPPKFLSIAVKYDHEAAKEILRMIQIIGNNSSISDAHFASSEQKFVRNCIARFEDAFTSKL